MKQIFIIARLFVFTIPLIISCNRDDKKKEPAMKEPVLKEQEITYKGAGPDSISLQGYIVYDENIEGKRPAVLVVPEWWGLNDYPKMRARELAKLGYFAMAVDIYGEGKIGETPDAALALAMPFYKDPQLGKARIDAALKTIMTYSEVDTSRVAAIGYCFGGNVVLNVAKLGAELDGVVSFHGGLSGPPPVKELLRARILICNGAADSLVPQKEIADFRKQMDSAGISYLFKEYPGALHAFTNPAATATGEKFKLPVKYNAEADSASWNDMKNFFSEIFR